MAITFPLTLPPRAKRVSITPVAFVAMNAADFTGKQTIQDWASGMWHLSITWPDRKPDTARTIAAFLTALEGPKGTFLAGDPGMKTPAGVATGTPKVSGSVASGARQITTKGWSNSITGILKAGDYIQIGAGSGARLYMVLVDANSNGSGLATLETWPPVREALVDNTAITTASPVGLFRLASSGQGWANDEEKTYQFALEAIEAI
jgi:hypothetical protein